MTPESEAKSREIARVVGAGRDGNDEYLGRDESKTKQALELRLQRMSYRQIGEAMGVSTNRARIYVQRGLRLYIPPEEVEEARKIELDELDGLARGARALFHMNTMTVTDVLMVIDRLIRIQERRSRLLGLDKPVKVDAHIQVTDQIDGEIEALLAAMGGGETVTDPHLVFTEQGRLDDQP